MIEEQNKKIPALETFLRAKPARKIDTSEAHILELQEKIVFLEEMLGKVIKQLESMGVPREEIG